MASLSKVPAAHRSTAERVPEHIRERMPQEELNLRAAHAHRIQSGAPQTGDAKEALFALSRKLLQSIPVGEYLEIQARLHQAVMDAPASSGFNSPADDLRAAGRKLKDDNHYPAGLLEACERRLLGRSADFPECDIDAVLNTPKTRSN